MRQMGGLLIVWLVAGCGGGAPGDVVVTLDAAPLVLAAGGVNVMPEAADTVSAGVNLARLGIAAVDAVYEVSTPAGESFRFEALTRAAENAGAVRVSIAHAAEDGRAPAGGVESLAEAGVVPGATGAASRGVWLDTTGDGFARVTIRGAIEKEQIIAVQTAGGEAPQTALICIRIGAPSVINPGVRGEGEYPGILSDDVIYSSDSWRFGLPTVAISGDRTTIVCYEGDLADPHSYARFELRLQHDKTTGEVTGGAGGAPGEDFGHWRDHEIAALFNVLAIAHSGEDGVIVRLSFDRGATFPQENILGAAGTGHPARLVQVAMAADYTLAVVFWRGGGFGPVPARPQSGNELVLVEGRPDAFDGGGSPTSFTFGAPVVLHREATDVSPVVMGAQYSSGGDLVVGYGFTTWETIPGEVRMWQTTTQFRCAVRLFGEAVRDTLVEESTIVGRDPSVALLGAGAGMRIFFAYEAADGVRLRVSDDAGLTFSAPDAVGGSGATLPSVFAREQGGATRVDLLYLGDGEFGVELFLRHWDDFGTTAPEDHRLTRSRREDTGTIPGPLPGLGIPFAPGGGFRITQIAWFGYDATLDGDEIVIAYDEETVDAYSILGAPELDFAFGGAGVALPAADGAEFSAALPPPPAEGLTESVAPPEDAHMHKLHVARIG